MLYMVAYDSALIQWTLPPHLQPQMVLILAHLDGDSATSRFMHPENIE